MHFRSTVPIDEVYTWPFRWPSDALALSTIMDLHFVATRSAAGLTSRTGALVPRAETE